MEIKALGPEGPTRSHAVRKQVSVNAALNSVYLFYTVQDPSLGNCATHRQQVIHSQNLLGQEILDTLKLPTEVNH